MLKLIVLFFEVIYYWGLVMLITSPVWLYIFRKEIKAASEKLKLALSWILLFFLYYLQFGINEISWDNTTYISTDDKTALQQLISILKFSTPKLSGVDTGLSWLLPIMFLWIITITLAFTTVFFTLLYFLPYLHEHRYNNQISQNVATATETEEQTFNSKAIHGTRKWLRLIKTDEGAYSEGNPDFLNVIQFEPRNNGQERPVGAFVLTNLKLLNYHSQLIRDGIIRRDSDLRRNCPPAYWDEVSGQGLSDPYGNFRSFYHRTHAISFRYSLDEGETRGLTFTGSGYLDNGEITGEYPSFNDENDPRHDTLVNLLMDIYVARLKSQEREVVLEKGAVINANYPSYSFEKLSTGSLAADDINLKSERGQLYQISMLHFERLSERILRYCKEDNFIYSCELHYEDEDAYLVKDVELILFNQTKNRIEFRALLANDIR